MFWRCSPQHGRIYLVQIADGLRIPLVFYIFYDPRDVGPSTAYWLFALGFFAPWVAVANKAIIAEVAPSKVLGSAVAMNAAMEGVFSSLVGAPLVGFLSQVHWTFTPRTHRIDITHDSQCPHNMLT